MDGGTCEWGSDGSLRRVVVVIPVRMPTWNCLLGMEYRKRRRCRDFLHRLTFMSLTTAIDSRTHKEPAPRPPWMRSLEAAYLRMIVPKKSAKSETDKKRSRRVTRRKRKSRLGSANWGRPKAGRKISKKST